MALINEIAKGELSNIPGVFMFRKYNSNYGFESTFKVNNDSTLDDGNNIVVPYLEYFKDANGGSLDDLMPVREKFYVVSNVLEVLYEVGEVMTAGKIAVGGEIIPNTNPVEYYNQGDAVAAGTIAVGQEIKVTKWMAANGWFMQIARTPITAQYGIMDSIEATLNALPQDFPNGAHLPSPY